MEKRFIFSGVLVVAMLFMFSLGVSAAIDDAGIIFEEDFTRPESEIGNPAWKPEGWELNSTRGEIERVHEDGYVELGQNGTAGNAEVIYRFSRKFPEKVTLMYDVCWDSYANRLGYQTCAINGYWLSINSGGTINSVDDKGNSANVASGAPDFDKWCTYVIQLDGDRATYFRKMEDEAEFTCIAENLKLQKSTVDYIRFYVYDANGAKSVSAKIDNIKVFSGIYMTDSEIEIAEDKSIITGNLTLNSADISPIAPMNTTVVMAAYDKKGKFMNIVTDVTQCIFFGEDSKISIEMPCDEAFYDAIKGGTVEMYVWDSMDGIKPVCDIVVLNID